MRFKRKFYAFTEVDKDTTDRSLHQMVTDFDREFAQSGADWFEEETRFEVGDITFVCFKLTFLEDGDAETIVIQSDEKVEPVVETHYFPGTMYPTNPRLGHFSAPGYSMKDAYATDHDYDSWWF